MSDQLLIELCRVIWNFDECRRMDDLSPDLRETAEWAVTVGAALADGKTLPSGFPVEAWSTKPESRISAGNVPDVVLRDAVLEGDLISLGCPADFRRVLTAS